MRATVSVEATITSSSSQPSAHQRRSACGSRLRERMRSSGILFEDDWSCRAPSFLGDERVRDEVCVARSPQRLGYAPPCANPRGRTVPSILAGPRQANGHAHGQRSARVGALTPAPTSSRPSRHQWFQPFSVPQWFKLPAAPQLNRSTSVGMMVARTRREKSARRKDAR
jgi:hypothetical protein